MNKGVGTGVIFLMIGLLLFAIISTDAYSLAFGKVRIEDKSYGTYENHEIAEGEIEYVVDKIGEATMKKKLFGIPYSTVTVPVYIISDNGGYVLLQSEKDADKLETLRQQTVDYFGGVRSEKPDKISYLGKATEISDEMLQVLDAYFTVRHVPAENWEYAISLYVLVGMDMTMFVVQMCISFGMIFVGILLILIFRRYVQGEVVYVGEEPPAKSETDVATDTPETESDSEE